jgi:hypothetical protein
MSEEEKVLHNLVTRFTSYGFYITNLKLFFMVNKNMDFYRSRALAKNILTTHKS